MTGVTRYDGSVLKGRGGLLVLGDTVDTAAGEQLVVQAMPTQSTSQGPLIIHKRKVTFDTVDLGTGVDLCDLATEDALVWYSVSTRVGFVSSSIAAPYLFMGSAAQFAANSQLVTIPVTNADHAAHVEEPALYGRPAISYNLGIYAAAPVTLQIRVADASLSPWVNGTAGEAWVFLAVAPGLVAVA